MVHDGRSLYDDAPVPPSRPSWSRKLGYVAVNAFVFASLQLVIAILVFLKWPSFERYDWFYITVEFMIRHAWNGCLLFLGIALVSKQRSLTDLPMLLGFTVCNFVVGLSDEVVNRYFNSDLFIAGRSWNIPDLEGYEWWMTFDEYLPLIYIAVVLMVLLIGRLHTATPDRRTA